MKTICIAKPFKTKNCVVQVIKIDNKYYVKGTDVFGIRIDETFITIDEAMCHFYYELCWMLNSNIMAKNISNQIMKIAE